MKDTAQTEEAPRIEMDSQTTDGPKHAGQKRCFRILHVDDDRCILEVSKQILSMENNFEVDDAISVDEAFKKMEKQIYDAVVSDYEMPLKDGLEFLKELREQKRDIPFILFTGKGREEVVVKALNLGADSYINKNGSPETVYCELADAINKTVERKKSKKALVESELKYRTVVEKSLQGILITQPSPLRLVFANQSMGKILGYSTEELKSLSPEGVAGLIYNEDRTVFFERLESRMHGEPANSSLEFRAVRKNGSIVWLEAFASRIEYMGQPAVQGMFLDIDERKKVSEILRESEARYRELANSLPDIVFESDTTGKLVFVNERALEIAGYAHEDFEKGLNILQFVAPEDRQRAMKSIQRLLAGGSYVPAEYVFLRKDGTTFPALITTTLRISKNKVTGLRGLVLDITERKKAEEVMRISEARYRELANFLPEIVFEADLTGKLTFFSQRAFEITGFTREELEKGLNMLSFVVPEEREKATENMKKSLAGEDLGANEYTLVRKNGTTYPAIVRTGPIISENKVTGLRGLVIDITERKKTEDAREQDRDMLEAITENLGAGFVTISKDYRVLYANKFVKNNVGDVEGKHCYATLNTLDHICPDCGVKKVFEDGVAKDAHEYSNVGIDGTPYYVELIATPLKDKDGNVKAALEFVVDIAEKKRMQQKLQASEAKFRAINYSAIDAIFLFDDEDRISYWNPAAERIFGYVEKEIVGEKVDETLVPPRFRKNHLSLIPKLAKGENKDVEGEILEFPALRKDGTEFPMEFSITPLQLNGKRHFVAIARDITERKKAEEALKRTMNELVLVNEKLNVVGSLTRHDVRNKLSVINGNVFILKKKHSDRLEIMDQLGNMEQACKSIDKIFDFAKMYERLGVEELSYIDVEKTIDEAVALFSGSINVNVINDCHGLTLFADSFLRQLFYNLIDNSIKHGGHVTNIRVYFEKVDEGRLILVYEDDGVGISAVNKPQLFKEGFSTSGTSGYGLYLIRKMMEVYGWAIQENGEPDKGAKFTITIPGINQKGKENFRIAL